MREYAITPYQGKEPYIFISYAHKDSEQVYPILEELNRLGYRVWYDDGIAPGDEWPEEVAQHLDGAHLVISMLSPRYVVSENCLRELQFSLAKKKAFLGVFLEDTELTLGLEMQLSAKRCILKYNYPTMELFVKKLCSSPDIALCYEGIDGATIASAEHREVPAQPKQRSDKLVAAGIVSAVLVLAIFLGIRLPKFNVYDLGTYKRKVLPTTIEENVVEVVDVDVSEGDITYDEGMTGDYEVTIYITSFLENGASSDGVGYGGKQVRLTLPEVFNGYRVLGIDQGAFQNNLSLKKITIPATVEEIGLGAFNGCSVLEEVEILGEKGANVVIDAPAFAGCTSLKKVILPARVSAISNNAFIGCTALSEVVLPEKLKSIGIGAFKQTGLEEITLPDSVTSIGESAFQNCSQLRSVVLPKALKTISYRTFYDCTALESVWIPASVKTIEEDAFFNCSSLQHIYFQGTEQQWNKLMSKIDFNYPDGAVLQNNMALQKAEIHFKS